MNTENIYAGWDGYGLRHIARHLARIEDRESLESLRKILFDFDYLQTKIKALDIFALIPDYDLLPGNNNVQLIKGALQLSGHILKEDNQQLAGQLLGRLSGFAKTNANYSFEEKGTFSSKERELFLLVEQIKFHKSEFPWLKPLISCLYPPGGSERFTLRGHEDTVRDVDMTPDGRFVISGSYDGTVKVWDLSRPDAEPRTLNGHEGEVLAVAMTFDGCLAVSGASDGTVNVWDLTQPDPEPKTLLTQEEAVYALTLTPDGRFVASGLGDGTIRVWDRTIPGIEPQILDGERYEVQAIALTPDGRLVVSGTGDGALQVWDLSQPEPEPRTFLEHESGINAVAISPDGKTVVSGSGDGKIKIWDLTEENIPPETLEYLDILYRSSGAVIAIAMTPDEERIVAGFQNGVLQIWDRFPLAEGGSDEREEVEKNNAAEEDKPELEDEEDDELTPEVPVLSGHGGAIFSVAVTSDGRLAVSGSDDATIKVWDLTNVYVEQPNLHHGHASGITAVAITPDGGQAFSWSGNNEFKEWDLTHPYIYGSSPSFRQYESNHFVAAIAPNRRLAVTGSEDGTLSVWEIPKRNTEHRARYEIPVLKPRTFPHPLLKRILKRLKLLEGHKRAIYAVAVTPDGRLAVSGSADHTIKVWNLTQRYARPRTLKGHERAITAVAITPNGSLVVSGSSDNTLRVWDLTRRNARLYTTIRHEPSISAVAVTLDGRRAITGTGDGTLHIWDLARPKADPHTMGGYTTHIRQITTTPDGRLAVTCSNSPTVHVWDLQNFQLLATFTGQSIINRVSISDHSQVIFAGGMLGEIYILQLNGWRKSQKIR